MDTLTKLSMTEFANSVKPQVVMAELIEQVIKPLTERVEKLERSATKTKSVGKGSKPKDEEKTGK